MTHWYDVVFWIFFGGGILFIAGIILRLIVQAIRDRPKPFVPKSITPYDTTWGVGGTDSSTAFDTSSSFDSGGSDSSSDSSGGSDSGGGFESGGGESGGGGSSGGWND